jgi:hypothetical protein
LVLTTPYHVYAQTSPLTEDQDGDGDPLNEETRIKGDCNFDFKGGLGEAVPGSFWVWDGNNAEPGRL